ncbi:hypothetical protein BDV23DRAFT_164027 [Aspergillus alliaceus]|uniref:Uncharacterized protein n=1 Tax=Petromyces alliaceus TaxID=209559 RepID=A0A5N7BWP2_PETAA|nr:hypothetical protein BDV23DRAFT_164027 [Aspergillus alliaceus]
MKLMHHHLRPESLGSGETINRSDLPIYSLQITWAWRPSSHAVSMECIWPVMHGLLAYRSMYRNHARRKVTMAYYG